MAISFITKLFATCCHYLRRYNELNEKRENPIEKTLSEEKNLSKEENQKSVSQQTTN